MRLLRQVSDKGGGWVGDQEDTGVNGALWNIESQGWRAISQSGANSCQSESTCLRGQQTYDRIQMEMSAVVAHASSYDTGEELQHDK